MTMVLGTLKSYVISALPYILVLFPLYGIARAIWLAVRKKRPHFWQEFRLGLLCLYTIFVLTVTVLPEISTRYGLNIYYPGGGLGVHNATYANIIPGNFLNYVGRSLQHYGGAALYVSLLGNVCLFLPIGFLSMLCFQGSWWKYLIAGAAFSICIEVYQLFLPRASDIDDVICNSVGMMIGYYIGKLWLMISQKRKTQTSRETENLKLPDKGSCK